MEVSPERFAVLVADALDALPEDLGRAMRNVAVVVDDDSPPGDLFGLYDGVPLTERGDAYGGTGGGLGGLALPDRITLFRQTICAACATEEEVTDEVEVTVVHEVAHHFGIDDDRLHELGWA